MIEKIKKLLGIGHRVDLGAFIADGAIIIDVRTTGEYAGGRVKGSLNIPLNAPGSQMLKLKKDKPIITCSASRDKERFGESGIAG